jgi:hypothetical protein
MTPAEVRSALEGSVGETCLITPRLPHSEVAGPELVFVLALNDEGFTYRILSNPVLYDPSIHHWMGVDDIEDVRPAAGSKGS